MTDLSQTNRQIFGTIMAFTALMLFFSYVYNTHTDTSANPVPFMENPSTEEVYFDYYTFLNEFKVFPEYWGKEQADLPATIQEGIQIFAAVFATKAEAYHQKLAAAGFALHDMDRLLRRKELFFLLSQEFPPRDVAETFFLGQVGEADFFAKEGLIDVPFDRQLQPEEKITRLELATTVARLIEPKLRAQNAPLIVNPRQPYTYARLEKELKALAAAYPDKIKLYAIGRSVEGRTIFAARLGQGKKNIFLDAAIHASEWLTTSLLMQMLEEYAHHAKYQEALGSFPVAELLNEVSIWFIPMVNPDGVTLVLEGPEAVKHGELVTKILAQSKHHDFSSWKANIRGVDLNRQFPASWKRLINVAPHPAPSHYKGKEPLSEPEAKALYDFTLQQRPSLTLSFHQQGEIIYWYNRQQGKQLQRDRQIARQLGNLTGYRSDQLLVNGGKYMDWVINELGVPAMIVEVGTTVGDLRQWDRIWQQNRLLGLKALEIVLQAE